jgi:predicted unusual protein kinase regulating ubiquinone biosynthesis (AarF/ABC1/UbiB family)
MFADSVRQDLEVRRVDSPSRFDPAPGYGAIGAMGRPATNVMRSLLVLEQPPNVRWWRVYARLLRLHVLFLWWVGGNTLDRLAGKSRGEARQRAAERLADYIQEMGGTLVKLGQQASMRKDLLPEEYCQELEVLFDRVPPFPVEEAYRAIEEQTGRPWQETFREFEEEPVGSASVACVYRAFLHSGAEVAVKVRRPGIDLNFATDIAALERIAKLLEYFMVVPPGLLHSFISEARTMLMEELNFRAEVRYQELFRRHLHRRKKLNVTAPKVYYELSGRDVIVSQFVRGFWVNEMMVKLGERDEQYLAELRGADIDPRQVARRLVRSQYYQFHECPFFHGDPHPGNIVVQPGGRIVMVDFGACGVFSGRDRNLMLQMHYYYTLGDVAGMVQCVVALIEPAPNIDIDSFSKELQDDWWRGYYGIKSKHADWSERTSFRLWVALLQAFRKYSLPMPLHMLRMVRATLLYDTVAAQLDGKINVFKQFSKYYRGVERRARVDIQESIIRQVLLGPDDSVYLKIKRVINVANALLFRVEKFLAEPEISFQGIVNKVYSFIDQMVQMFKTFLGITLFAGGVGLLIGFYRYFFETNVTVLNAINPIYMWDHASETWPGYVVFWVWAGLLLLTALSHGSRMLSQFKRKDDYPQGRRVV